MVAFRLLTDRITIALVVPLGANRLVVALSQLRTTSSAIAIKSMALLSRADYAPWASGTSLLHQPRLWQNGFAERLIGSIRRECVDHFIVLGETHLRQILRSYARYYNEIRTHQSLDKDAPVSRPVQLTGVITSIRSLADFIATTSGFSFSVHTGGPNDRREIANLSEIARHGVVRIVALPKASLARTVATY